MDIKTFIIHTDFVKFDEFVDISYVYELLIIVTLCYYKGISTKKKSILVYLYFSSLVVKKTYDIKIRDGYVADLLINEIFYIIIAHTS